MYRDNNVKSYNMRLFKNANKEKSLIDEELALYKREQTLKIDQELADRRKEIEELAIKCADDTKGYEHTFHQNKENLKAEIAKLEAKRDHLKELTESDKIAYERIIKDKDKEIERLNNVLIKIVENQPKNIVQVKD